MITSEKKRTFAENKWNKSNNKPNTYGKEDNQGAVCKWQPTKEKQHIEVIGKCHAGSKGCRGRSRTFNLYDIDFKGCKSCFACQLKNAKTGGVCALKDDLRTVLEHAHEADVIIIGSPVYFHYPTGEVRSFLERLNFPNFTYEYDAQGNRVRPIDPKNTAMIFTMNVNEATFDDWGYRMILGKCAETMRANFGKCEELYVFDTYQFNDYSRYANTMFDEEVKRRHRDEQFPKDLNKAYELGKRLVETS